MEDAESWSIFTPPCPDSHTSLIDAILSLEYRTDETQKNGFNIHQQTINSVFMINHVRFQLALEWCRPAQQ